MITLRKDFAFHFFQCAEQASHVSNRIDAGLVQTAVRRPALRRQRQPGEAFMGQHDFAACRFGQDRGVGVDQPDERVACRCWHIPRR